MSHTNVKKVNNDSTDYDLPVLRRLAKLQRPQTAHGVPLTWLETEKRVGLTGNGGPSGQLLVGSVDRATTPMKRNPIPKSRPTSALPNSVSNSMSVDSSEPVATKALFRTTTIEKSSSCGEYEPAAKSLASPLPARPRPHTSTGTRDRSPGMKRITRGVGCGEGNINRSVAASPTSRSHSPCRPTSPSKLHSSSMLSLPSSTSRPISVTQKISFLMAEVELAKQRSKLLPPEVFKKYMEENSTMCKNERKMKIGTGINQSSVDSTGDFNFFDDDFEGLNSCRSNGSSSSRRPVSSSGWGANHLIRLFRDPEESGSCKNSKSGGNSSRKEVKSALRPRTAPGGLGENQGLSHIEATDGSTTSRSALKSGRSIGKGNISARSNVSVQFSDDVKLNSKPNPNLKSLPSRQVLKSGGSAFSNECVKSTGSVGVAMQLDNSPVLAKAADGSDNFRTPPTTPPSGGGRKRAQSISVSPQVVKSKIFFPDSEATKSPGGSARHDLTDNDAREEAIRVNREMRAAAMKIVRTVQAISAQIEEHPDGNVFDSLPDAEKDMFTKYKHATLNNVFQSLVLMETTRSYESSSDWLSYRDSMNSISRGGSSLASRTQDRIEAAKKRKKDSEAAEKRAMMEKVNERKRKRLQAQMEENRRIVQKQWLLYCRVLATANVLERIVQTARDTYVRRKQEALKKRATFIIEAWWLKKKYKDLMRRHKLATYILRIQMRKYWAILRIRERRASVVLIRQFLVDTGKLGNSMSQIYKYRACVIKAQRCCRNFVVCKMARLQLLYRVVARMENRRLVEAMHEVKMAELMKKAKARQLEESRSCFGRALVDHRKIDFAERKRLNATENRIEARLIKRRDRLEDMLEEVAQREEKHEKSQKSQAAAMLVHDVGVCPSTVPWEELTAAQLEPLRIILSQQRKSHILGYTAKLEKAAQMKQFKEVEINDVKAFLSVAPSCVNVNTAPNTSPNTLGLNTNNSSVDAKNLRSLSDLIFNEIQTSPKLLETTMLLLTSNNCIKQLEALPRELFAPPTSPTHKGFGSIMQRHKSMAALMTINR